MRLAAEQIFHMIEGWRYAASATAAYLSNSKHNSVHFSYYAELRAALSLLSWSGIRVRQGDHYYLDGQNTKIAIGSCRTHTAVWAFWQHWTNRADANSLFRNKSDSPQAQHSQTFWHLFNISSLMQPCKTGEQTWRRLKMTIMRETRLATKQYGQPLL